jgi:hypothetical protein
MSILNNNSNSFLSSSPSGGGGGATGQAGYYGSFFDTQDQFALNTTDAYPVEINNTDSAATNGISIENDSLGNPTKIVFQNSGIYSITWSIQFVNTDNNNIHDANVWLRKNAENATGNLADSNSIFSVPEQHGGVDGHLIGTVNYVLSLNANDYLQICFSVTDIEVSLQTLPTGTTPTVPQTPCIILTAFNISSQGLGYASLTSTTSNTLGLGSKTFTTNLSSTETAFNVGTRARVSGLITTNYLEGVITAFSGNSLTIDVDSYGGTGTLSSWTFSVTGSQGATGAGITTLNTLTSLTQTFATGTSGSDFAINSSGSIHTFDLPTASSVNRGALSTTDWSRFANFQVLTAYQNLGSVFKSILLSNPSISNLTQPINLSTAQLRLIAVHVPIAATITGVKWYQSTQGNFTGNGYNGVGLYTYSGGTATLVASSTDSEATWETFSANTWGNVAFSTPYSASAGTYYIAALFNGGATAPALLGTVNSGNANVNIGDFSNSAKLSLTLGSQASLPATVSMSGVGVAVSANNLGLYLY